MFDWVFKTLSFLGLYKKRVRMLFLGLDNAGKTTLLGMLKSSAMVAAAPTQQVTSEELVIGNIHFKAYDLGGHEVARHMWQEYYVSCGAITYIIDATDQDRFETSRAVLTDLLENPDLKTVPFLILLNKMDKPGAARPDAVISYFGLSERLTGKENSKLGSRQRALELFPCSIKNKSGYAEGFRWLSNFV